MVRTGTLSRSRKGKSIEPPALETYSLALWGSMLPWRAQVIHFLRQLGYDTTKVFDPTQGEWSDEARQREEDAKLVVPRFIHYVTGGRDDPRHAALQSVEEIDQLVNGPGDGIFILDPAGLNRHDARVLGYKVTTLETQGQTVVRSLGDSLPWLVQRLGLRAAFENFALGQLGDVINAQRSTPGIRSLADYAQLADEADRPSLELWVRIIDENVSRHVAEGGSMPLAIERHLVINDGLGVHYAELPNLRVIDKLNDLFWGQLRVLRHDAALWMGPA